MHCRPFTCCQPFHQCFVVVPPAGCSQDGQHGNTMEASNAVTQLDALEVRPGTVRRMHTLPPGPQGGMVSVLHDCVQVSKAELPPTEVGLEGFMTLHTCVGPGAAERLLLRC